MQSQNYKNHTRLIPLYHGVTFTAILTILVLGIIQCSKLIKAGGNTGFALMLVLIPLVMISQFFFSRIFALKAQDRAIRAEENLRHFVLTGQPLDARLNIGQIIALRFAGNDEFPALAKKAAEEGLGNKEIKLLVQNWRADNHRV